LPGRRAARLDGAELEEEVLRATEPCLTFPLRAKIPYTARVPAFDDVLARLPAPQREQIIAEFSAWQTIGSAQVRENIMRECALSLTAFTELLTAFAASIAAGATGVEAWGKACRGHKLRGEEIKGPRRPRRAARVMTLETYVGLLVRSTGLTRDAALDLLEASNERIPQDDDAELIRATRLGSYVIWATTHADAPDQDPYDALPHALRCLCVTLGLGDLADNGDPMVYVSYRPASTVPMFRSTVADAGNYPYYRPHADATDPFGRTAPHACRPCDHADHAHVGQIEFVHPEITGEGLVFPYRIVR
jgi:hypothetical protein